MWVVGQWITTRPRGKAPAGKVWNGLTTRWVTAASVKPLRVRLRAWRKPDYAPSWDVQEGRWIVVKPNKKQPSNATKWDPVGGHWIIKRPRGQAPGGKRWDYRHGAWVTEIPVNARKPKLKVWDEVEGAWVRETVSDGGGSTKKGGKAAKAKAKGSKPKAKAKQVSLYMFYSLHHITEYSTNLIIYINNALLLLFSSSSSALPMTHHQTATNHHRHQMMMMVMQMQSSQSRLRSQRGTVRVGDGSPRDRVERRLAIKCGADSLRSG